MNLDQQIDEQNIVTYKRKNSKTTDNSSNGFYDLGIMPGLIKAIDRLKFTTPTPIQKDAIPIGILGKDIIGIAQTGSGKTLAFGIPMLQRLSKSRNTVGLIIVPTRELALQVDEAIRSISTALNARSVVLIGGASMVNQRIALKKNPRIIIATPGRLMDHVDRRTVKLDNVEMLVLDEADRMLDMGFAPDIKKIMKSVPESRQTMLFSATMPKSIEAMATQLLNDPSRIEVDRSGVTPAEVSQEMFVIKNQEKARLLALKLKDCEGPVLVFTRTKRMASKLAEKVNKMGFDTAEIHSNRSLGQRRNALDGFKARRYQILIATDIAARGIDVSGIELVVNYDMPATAEDYVHRIGRTGRAGKTGHAISFANTDQKRAIKSFERFLKIKLAISEVPALPTEKNLFEEGELINARKVPERIERPSRRSMARERSPRRPDFNRGNSRRYGSNNSGSNQGGYQRRDSENRSFRRNDSDRPESSNNQSRRYAAKNSDSNQGGFKRKYSDRGDFRKKDSDRSESTGNYSRKFAAKRSDSNQTGFKRKSSDDRNFKRNDSAKPESKHNSPKPKKKSLKSAISKADTFGEIPFWSNFTKKRSTSKKKSVGQGGRRKNKSKK